MKKFTVLFSLVFCSFLLFGQAPQGFNYQCVIRDANGTAQPNQTVNLVFVIKEGGPFGASVYSEEHNGISTNAVGLINVQIGTGQNPTGNFATITWGTGPKYLETAIKNGAVFTSLGTVQLMSVPYALYAEKSGTGSTNYIAGSGIGINGNVISNTGDGDSNSSNELQSLLLNGNQLSISGTNFVTLPTSPNYVEGPGIDINGNTISNSGDLSSTNELQNLVLNGNQLSVTNGNSVFLPTANSQWDFTGNHIVNNNNGSVFINVPNGNFFSSPASLNVQSHVGMVSPDQSQVFNMTLNNDGRLRFNANYLDGTGEDVIIFDDEDNSVRIPGIAPDYFFGEKLNFGDSEYVYLREFVDDELEIYAADALSINSNYVTISSPAVLVTTLINDGIGFLRTNGQNGLTNVAVSALAGYPNNGYVSVQGSGNNRAGIYVNSSGQGVVFGDVKNFRMKHPSRPGKEIWYASLEGPEAAAYVRGTSQLNHGEASVEFSEDFAIVANPTTMTVILTPLSANSKGMAVIEKTEAGFSVKELFGGTGNYSFDWEVKCVRKGYENYQVVRDEREAKPYTDNREQPAKTEKKQKGEVKPPQQAKPDKF